MTVENGVHYMEVVIIDNMEGNIYIKGNLYVTDDMIPALLSKNGLVIRVKKDVIFLSEHICKYGSKGYCCIQRISGLIKIIILNKSRL